MGVEGYYTAFCSLKTFDPYTSFFQKTDNSQESKVSSLWSWKEAFLRTFGYGDAYAWWRVTSLVSFCLFWPCCAACGVSVPLPGSQAPCPQHWTHRVLTTGHQGIPSALVYLITELWWKGVKIITSEISWRTKMTTHANVVVLTDMRRRCLRNDCVSEKPFELPINNLHEQFLFHCFL